MENIGNNIKKVRKEKNMTQNEFASAVGISRSYLGDLENNRKSPSADTIRKLAKNLKVSETYLLTGKDDYASILIDDLEEELSENESISKNIAPLIIADVKNRLFPKYFHKTYTNRDDLEKAFMEFKTDAIETWTNYDSLDLEIVSRIQSNVNETMSDGLKYFYLETYEELDSNEKRDKKISDRSEEFVSRIQKLNDFNRAYLDCFRFIDSEHTSNDLSKKISKELDKIDSYTKKLKYLNGTIEI